MLRVIVGLIAALCTAGCATTADDVDTAWPLAVRIHSYGEYQDAAWEHLPSIGVNYIFLSVPAADEKDVVMTKLAAHGLTPVVLRGDADLSKPTFAEDLAPQLAICEQMGVQYMFLSAKRGGTPKETAYERLRAAGDIAKEHGVIIGLETHPDLGTNGTVQVETMEGVSHPNVRVNFDTANITYYNKDTSAVAELEKSIGYLGMVEFKDHNGEFETWVFPVLGEGVVDFPTIVDRLHETGYTGPVTIEFEGTKGVELNREQTLAAIEACVEEARKLANFK